MPKVCPVLKKDEAQICFDSKLTEMLLICGFLCYKVYIDSIFIGINYLLLQIGIYEDIRKSRQLTMHCDKDLSLGDLIKKGRYSLLHKGFLQMKGQQIAVMVKSINGKNIAANLSSVIIQIKL